MLNKNMLGKLVQLIALCNDLVSAETQSIIKLIKDLVEKLDGQRGAEWLKAFKRFLRGEEAWTSVEPDKSTEAQLHRRLLVFHKYFGIVPDDIDELIIPERQPGRDRLEIVAKGTSPQGAMDVAAKLFPSSCYVADLDKETEGRNVREAAKTYAYWVRDRVEADEENKNLSANQLADQNRGGQTILERIIHEISYWDETGDHLDKENVTLCDGSRGLGGGVPSADWSGGFRVDYAHPSSADARLRSRSAGS